MKFGFLLWYAAFSRYLHSVHLSALSANESYELTNSQNIGNPPGSLPWQTPPRPEWLGWCKRGIPVASRESRSEDPNTSIFVIKTHNTLYYNRRLLQCQHFLEKQRKNRGNLFNTRVPVPYCMLMRFSRVVRWSGCQFHSRNSTGTGFDSSILRHNGIWGAADVAVLKNIHKKK